MQISLHTHTHTQLDITIKVNVFFEEVVSADIDKEFNGFTLVPYVPGSNRDRLKVLSNT